MIPNRFSIITMAKIQRNLLWKFWMIFMISVLIITFNVIPYKIICFTSTNSNVSPVEENDSITMKSSPINEVKYFVNTINNNLNDTNEFYILLSSHLNNPTMTPHNNIIVFSLKNEQNVLYHCNNDKAGMGNNMYHYWFSRAFAYYFNLKYQFVINKKSYIIPNTSTYIQNILMKTMHCKNRFDDAWTHAINQRENISTQEEDNYVSKFVFLLPTYSENTFLKYIIKQVENKNANLNELLTNYHSIQLYLLKSLIEISKDKFTNNELLDNIYEFRHDKGLNIHNTFHYPWGNTWKMFYLNDVFRKNVIVPETLKVFLKYKHLLNVNQIQTFNKYDIVIHIRCGDAMSWSRTYLQFNTFNFFRQSLNHIAITNTNFSDHTIKEKNVYFLLQLLDEKQIHHNEILNTHSEKLSDANKCKIFADIVIPQMKEIFNIYNYSSHLISNGSLHEDLYRLITAPNVICGASTFCKSASLANINATNIIWPSNSSENYPVKNIFLIKNYMINSKEIIKHKLSPQQIAQYVINH
eukprot:409366_1